MEARVEAATRELVRIINGSAIERRKPLREAAIHLLRDQVEILDGLPVAVPAPATGFNPFGIGLPLLLGGGVLIFLFPPVGLMLFLASAVMMAWGAVVGLVKRR